MYSFLVNIIKKYLLIFLNTDDEALAVFMDASQF